MATRFLKTLVHALVLAQVLLSAPVISAAVPSGAGAAMPCHGEMTPTADHEIQCTCCPDGVTSSAGCLAQCAGATATHSTFLIPVGANRFERIESAAFIVNGDPADPPLKPPPIL